MQRQRSVEFEELRKLQTERTHKFLNVPIEDLQDLLIPKGHRIGVTNETHPDSCKFCETRFIRDHVNIQVHPPVLCQYCLSPICSDMRYCPICHVKLVNQIRYTHTTSPVLCDYAGCGNVAATQSGKRKKHKCVKHIMSTNDCESDISYRFGLNDTMKLRSEDALLMTLARLYVRETIPGATSFYSKLTWVEDLPMFERYHQYFSDIYWEPALLTSFEHSRKETLRQFFMLSLPIGGPAH